MTKTEARAAVISRDGFRCYICHEPCWPGNPDTRRILTLDHIIPGGPSTPENMAVCCRSCNSRKGGRGSVTLT